MKQHYLFSLLALVFVTVGCTKNNPVTNDQQPNIVVFVVDDMGLMDTSVPFVSKAGKGAVEQPLNSWYQTPNMESLAEEGIRFTQFYAQSVCSPTRASLLTGQNATRHHTTTWIKPTENNRGEFGPKHWNWQGLNSSSTSFPQLLSKAGYKTIHVGKGHFGPLESEGAEPKNLGFDVNVAGAAWGRPKSYFGRDQYGNHQKYQSKNKTLTHNIPHLEEYYKDDVFLTEALTLAANKHIEIAKNDQQPFLLYLSHYAVHAPFNSDPRFAKNYEASDKKPNAKAYATLIEGMDKSLGDVVSKLNELGVAEDTLIVFLGDNGGDAPLGGNDVIASSAPFRGKKGTSWEGGMRAPLMVSWAKVNDSNPLQQQFPIAKGAINSQVATILDVYPTLLSVANVENPQAHVIDGFDLKKQLVNEYDDVRDNSFLMHFPHDHRHSYFTSYREDNLKVIYHYNPSNKKNIKRYQLYNLENDPTESNDLAASNPAQLLKIMKSMIAKLESQNAQYPTDKHGQTLKPLLPSSAI